jgi:hypothetical protein
MNAMAKTTATLILACVLALCGPSTATVIEVDIQLFVFPEILDVYSVHTARPVTLSLVHYLRYLVVDGTLFRGVLTMATCRGQERLFSDTFVVCTAAPGILFDCESAVGTYRAKSQIFITGTMFLETWQSGLKNLHCMIEDPNPCGSSLAEVSGFDLTQAESGSILRSDSCEYELSRYDTQDGMRYLMEEWTIVSHSDNGLGNSSIEVLSASSPAYAAAKMSCMHQDGNSLPRPQEKPYPILVLDRPAHPGNSRYIPSPRVSIRDMPFDLSESMTTRAVVRADLGVDREIHEIDLLYSSARLPESFLDHVRKNLIVEYQDEGSHRLVLFLFLETSGRAVQLKRVEEVLPLCCCGEEFCV